MSIEKQEKRIAPRITIEELKLHMLEGFQKYNCGEEDDEELLEDMKDPTNDECMRTMCYISEIIQQDKHKVDFDLENCWIDEYKMLGDLAIIKAGAGGDWEHPTHFVLYWDGSEIRAYVPTAGNTFHVPTMTAYGNDIECPDINPELNKELFYAEVISTIQLEAINV